MATNSDDITDGERGSSLDTSESLDQYTPLGQCVSLSNSRGASSASSMVLSPDHWRAAVAFHGHECPGLAIGFKAVEAAVAELGLDAARLPAVDEELVCVTENDACGVDAIQSLLGCTYGKANLIPRLRGKMAFTFYVRDASALRTARVNSPDVPMSRAIWTNSHDTPASRAPHVYPHDASAPRAVRVYLRDAARGTMSRDEYLAHLLETPYDQLFKLEPPHWPLPEPARHFDSQACARCGEVTAEYALRLQEGALLCLDCYQPYDREGF